MPQDKRTSKDIRKEIKSLKKLIRVKEELLSIALMQEELYQIKLQKTFDNAFFNALLDESNQLDDNSN